MGISCGFRPNIKCTILNQCSQLALRGHEMKNAQGITLSMYVRLVCLYARPSSMSFFFFLSHPFPGVRASIKWRLSSGDAHAKSKSCRVERKLLPTSLFHQHQLHTHSRHPPPHVCKTSSLFQVKHPLELWSTAAQTFFTGTDLHCTYENDVIIKSE